MDTPLLDPTAPVARAARVAAIACAVHCAATPLALLALPAAGAAWLATPALESGIVAVALALAAPGLAFGLRRHRDPRPLLVAFAAGALLLAVESLVPHGSAAETALRVAGGLALAAASLWNARRLRRSGACCAVHAHRHD